MIFNECFHQSVTCNIGKSVQLRKPVIGLPDYHASQQNKVNKHSFLKHENNDEEITVEL